MAEPDDTGLTPEGTLPKWEESQFTDGNADGITQTPRPANASENGAATITLPVLPLETHRKDQERRRKARQDLEKALEDYFATLTRFRDVEITKVAEILGSYASEIYDSSAAGYLAIPSLDPEALFGIAGPLNGGMAIADVEKQVSTLRVRRPWKILKDPAVRRLDDGRESMGLYFDDPWLRHEIREIVARRVHTTRNAYAGSNQTIANEVGTRLPNSSKVFIDSPPAVSARPLTRLMSEYEERLPLLTTRALERLRARGAERERMLSIMIESAEVKSLEQMESLASTETTQAQRTAWREDATKARLAEIVQMAADAARATVVDFAEGLLLSQQRLAVHADLLRDYTARLIREVRSRVVKSDALTSELSLRWQDDPIAQNAIRACEEKIDERSLIEGEEVPGRLNQTLAPKAWSPIVLQWESRKVPPQKPLAGPERIPESELLALIAEQICCNPEDVTEVQIQGAASELCSHYESFQIAPGESNDHALADYRALCEIARPDSAFWKGREDEFRQHNTGENALLCAWLLSDDRWTFYIGGSMASPSAEVSRSFKSLAREAAKGLRNRGGRQSWIDWLELLSCAEDEDTGKRHYSVMEGSSYSPEKAFQRDRAAGDEAEAPRNAFVEYRLTSQGGLEKGRRWYTRSPRIENLFAKSAGQCLELRSLTSQHADIAPPDRNQASATPPLDRWREAQPQVEDALESGKVTPVRTTPFKAPTVGVIPMKATQREVRKYANEIFLAAIEDRIVEYAKHQAQALGDARLTKNAGAYLHALIRCKQERLRMEILLLADAWVEAGNIYEVALHEWAQTALEKTALQITASICSTFREELNLRAARTKRPRNSSGGGREIRSTMILVLRQAHLKLETQRIKIERALEGGASAVNLTPTPVTKDAGTPMHGEVPATAKEADSDTQKTHRKEVDDRVPTSLKRTKREPHANPEIILAGKDRVTYDTAAGILGVSKRRVAQFGSRWPPRPSR